MRIARKAAIVVMLLFIYSCFDGEKFVEKMKEAKAAEMNVDEAMEHVRNYVQHTDSRDWKGIVIHHSGTEGGNVEAFRKYHRSKGWEDVGYHFVVRRDDNNDGRVEIGRGLDRKGAHALNGFGERNRTHIGICLVGDQSFTGKQYERLQELIAIIEERFGKLPQEAHHQSCPGDGLKVERTSKDGRFLNAYVVRGKHA
jgi:N-acetyl-anhydromuramyl-L-alanine amidase AmpD